MKLFEDFLESVDYFNSLGYNLSKWFASYGESFKERVEGWKTHIVIENDDDYLFMADKLLPVLRSNKIKHKVVYHSKYKKFNDFKDTQSGKIITIYDKDLTFLNVCDTSVLDFLFQETHIKITSDKCIGGRVFVRYTGFTDDMVLNPSTNELEVVPRKEGYYKPNWVKEPPMLDDLLQITK